MTDTPPATATATYTDTATESATPSNTATASSTPSATLSPSETPTAVSSNRPLYVSLNGGGSVGGIAAEDVDILYFDGTTWSLFFDASDVGISTSGRDLNDFEVVAPGTILMTFDAVTVLGALTVDPWDIVQFNAASLGANTSGQFSLYLDGSDVGLDTAYETIDALDVLPDGRVLVSVAGSASLPGLTGLDEDILAFAPSTLGDFTSGVWTMYFDGSDGGLADSGSEDVCGLDVPGHGEILFVAAGDFSVSNISGTIEDVFVCAPVSLGDVTACNYASSLYFDGSLWSLDANSIDGIDIP
jgi:hypothetical protein